MDTTPRTTNWIRSDKRLAIYLRDDLACAYCSQTIEDGSLLTLDHVLAHHLGGTNDESNLVTCCGTCNSRKQAKTIRGWYRVLRAAGLDTTKVARRVRTVVSRDLAPYRMMARRMMAARQTTSALATLLAA